MHKQLLGPIGIGAALILAAVGVMLYLTRGAHIELTGSVLKVRTMALDENSSLAVVDFRFANPADYPFVVRSCTVHLQDGSGKALEGFSVPETDARRIFEYYPILGPKYNDTLVLKDKIPAHNSQDRMIAARFEIPVDRLEARQRLSLRIEEIDGVVSEIEEKRK